MLASILSVRPGKVEAGFADQTNENNPIEGMSGSE